MTSTLGYIQADVPVSQPEWPLYLPSRVLLLVPSINWGTRESNYLLKGSEKENRNQEETLSFLLHALCTGEQSTGLDTYPAIGKNSIALFHQDVFDEDGVQNGQHRLPAIKNPKPRETHSQSIAHGQLEQKQPALSVVRAVHIDCWSPKGLGQLSPL